MSADSRPLARPRSDEVHGLWLPQGITPLDQPLQAGALKGLQPGPIQLASKSVQRLELRRLPPNGITTGAIPFQAAHNLGHEDLARGSGELIPPLRTADTAQNPAAPKAGEHLLQLAIGNALARGDLAHLQHPATVVKAGQLDQSHQAVFGLGAEGHWFTED